MAHTQKTYYGTYHMNFTLQEVELERTVLWQREM